jgi:predicted branched-subunit amino acid permease
MGQTDVMPSRPSESPRPPPGSAFVGGLRAGFTSVFVFVLVGTYLSLGALSHDLGFPAPWIALSTALIWAAPAQVMVCTALAGGGPPIELAIAVSLSGMRLLPMVVALLPQLRTPATRMRDLVLPAHFTAVSMWVETLRLAPQRPHAERISFTNGIGTAFVGLSVTASLAGYYAAAQLPVLLVSALLFLTPMSFLSSAVRNGRLLSDRLATVLGLVMAPLLAWYGIGLDLMWTGIVGGTAAYAIHRLIGAAR